jgi:Protein of unknown function (DUF3551)
MRRLTIAGLALAAFAGACGEAHPHTNSPWCIIGYHRSVDCAFASREQCIATAVNIGVARRCFQNPFYSPARASFIAGTSPGQLQATAKSHRSKSAAH